MRGSRAVAMALPLLLAACPPIKDSSEKKPPAGTPAVKAAPAADPAVAGAPARPAAKRATATTAEAAPAPAAAAAPMGGRRDPADPAAARKQPLSIEALYGIPSVADPQWSPDGQRVLFVVTRHDLKEGKSNADIYLVDAAGAKTPKRMTRHLGSDRSPRWAPDGKSFLFLSSRGGSGQLWRMPADGGEAEQLTKISTGVSQPAWSPDGGRIAFVSQVFPEHGADDAANKAALEAVKATPLKAHLADELFYRHWTSYRGGRRNHILVFDLKTKAVADLTPGDFDSPAISLGGGGFDWSPDGKELCFTSNRERPSARAWTTNKDLWLTPAAGGKARNITAGNKGYDGHPVYSPDGKHIAFLRQQTPGYEAAKFDLVLYERPGGAVRSLTGGFDNWALDMRWTADSGGLLFKAPIQGRFPLLRVSAAEGGAVGRVGVPMARGFDLSKDGRIAFIHTAVDRPTDLYVTDGKGGAPRRLTTFGQPAVDSYDLRPAEELWLPGAGGRKVHTFVVKPHGFTPGKKYPLIINVHGGPQYQWSDMLRGDWQVYPAAGYVVAFFNPHGSIGYGQAYTAAISQDWGGKVYQDVMKVTDALVKLDYVDPERVGAMGWSYGGYMMNWILGHTRRFKALVSMMGLYDLDSFYGATEELWFPEWDLGGTPWGNRASYRKWSPAEHADKFKTPTLVITGEKDYRVPYTQSLQLFTALRRRDVPARLIVFPNDGHWPSFVKSMPLYYAAHLDWFARYLGGGGSPWKIEDMVRGRIFKKGKDR